MPLLIVIDMIRDFVHYVKYIPKLIVTLNCQHYFLLVFRFSPRISCIAHKGLIIFNKK